MNESKLSLTTERRKEQLKRLRQKRAAVQWTILMAFFAVLLGIRLGIPSVVKWFAGTWIWQHSLAGHLRLQLISFGCMLEILGVWGFTIDTKPYYFFRDKGVEPFWGFVERTRQLLFDLGCVIGGGICFLRALSSYHY